jgi:hypothetical protein
MKVVIRRVKLTSLGRMGCLLGIVAAFLPSLLCGLLGLGLATLVRHWLESWQQLTISLLGQEVATFDLVQFLSLDQLLNQLQTLATVSGSILFLAVVALALITGALLALIVMLVGLVYNLLAATTGGVVVEMSPAETQKAAE